MSNGVWFDLFPMILAHLSPRKRARWRLVCKRMCALISAGEVARKFWGKDYKEFRRDIVQLRDGYRQLFLNETWSPTMFYKILAMMQDILFRRKQDCRIEILKDHGFEGGGCPMIITNLFNQCSEFVVGLVEGLFTLNDFTNNVSIPYYREFLRSKYGLQMLREKHVTLTILGSAYDFKTCFSVRRFFDNENALQRFRNGLF